MRRLSLRIVLWIMTLWMVNPGEAADVFTWDQERNRVTANFRNWSLEKTLTQIRTATQWDVNIPEDSGVTISGTFSDLTPGLALRHMFGHLNYAVFSLPNGKKPRLKVFLPSPESLEATKNKKEAKPASTANKNPFNRNATKVNYADVMKRFDKNGDGLISNAEREAARKALSTGNK